MLYSSMGTIPEEDYCNFKESTKKSNQVSVQIKKIALWETIENVKSIFVGTKTAA